MAGAVPTAATAMIAALAMPILAIPSIAARADTGECYPDWSVAAPIVRQHKLASVEELALLTRDKLGGAVVKTVLCREGEGYVYRIVVRSPKGVLQGMKVDAQHPFAR